MKLLFDNQFIRNYMRMWPFFRPYWWQALGGVLLTIPAASGDAVIAGFLKSFTDRVMIDRDHAFSFYIPFMIVGFTFVIGTINYLSNYVNTWVGNIVTMGIKQKLYEKLLIMDTSYFDNNTSGTILFRYNTDAEAAASGLINNLKMFLTRFFSSVALIGMLIYQSWQLSIIAIAILLFAFLPLTTVRRRMKRIMNKTIVPMTAVITAYNETFSGNKTIASYNLHGYQQKKFSGLLDGVFKFTVKMVRNTNWLSPAMQFIMSIGVALIIGLGGVLIVNGSITSGNFVAFLASLLMLYTPLKGIGNNFVSLQYSFMAIERLYEILELETKIKDAPNAKVLEGVYQTIVFKDVCFEYVSNRPVLKQINLNAKVGETVALVGNSGGGKSTIANLIPRFYDIVGGSIMMDGVDIREYTLNSLRSQIGVVFQDNFLFDGTIRENIMLGNPDVGEEELRDAIQNAHLSDFINSLEKGVDTPIGERGVMLSGGQRQRIAIARAFLKDAPILILDEATSALDNKSEAIVQAAINDLMKNRTVFVIAHRLSTVQNADKIIVLNEGEIMEEGKHDELLDKNGFYASLYHAQFKKQNMENEFTVA